jgi:hypothetical protein
MISEEDINSIVKKAITEDRILSKVLHGILSKNDEIRSKSFKILMLISKRHPEVLYFKWDFIVDLLISDNHYHRYFAINVLPNVISVDSDNKFDDIFDKYFRNIKGKRTMVAGQTALNSGKIAKERPDLQNKIVNILLNIDKLHQGKQTELMKAYAIEAFNDFIEDIEDKKEILKFVKLQINSSSHKTKKLAGEFLKKWNKK